MYRHMIRLIAIFTVLFLTACGGCNEREHRDECDLGDPSTCPAGERCVDDRGISVCEELESCDPAVPGDCPGGYICRPLGDRAVCEPELSAGRIPHCIDSEGIDVFAVEAYEALSVSWNVRGDFDHRGGFLVEYGVASQDYHGDREVDSDVRHINLRGLDNGVTHYVVVHALDPDGDITHTSCELDAVPRMLEFQPEVLVSESGSGDQLAPAIASTTDGHRIYLVWEDGSRIVSSLSTDFGDTWDTAQPVAPGSGQSNPDVAVRQEIRDGDGDLILRELAYIAWEESGEIWITSYDPEDDEFDEPTRVASGNRPAIAVTSDVVHVVFEDGGDILHTLSEDRGVSFDSPVVISSGVNDSSHPAMATSIFTDDVFVGWHGYRGSGDSDIYAVRSLNGGISFDEFRQVDDDPGGNNQRHVSINVNERSQTVYASWEDRRGGANVYFSWSDDWGESWEDNIDVGAGMGGDQFRPQAVVDVAGNVYVAMQDTSSGRRVVFSRFNAEGSFDPPLIPSGQAGAAGVVADNPAVAADHYGAVFVAWEEDRHGNVDIFFARAE